MSLGAVQMLQKSLAEAQKDLSSTNDAIKKITGRDPDVPPSRPGPERRSSAGGTGRMRAWSGSYEAPAAKRRDLTGSRTRLAGRMGPLAGRLGPHPGRRVSEGSSERRRDSDGEESSEKSSRTRLAGRLGPLAGRVGPHPGRRVSEGRSERRRDSDGEESNEKSSGKVILPSSVVATTAPPRPSNDPAEDQQSKKRNQRMFGFLMGTLQQFKQTEEAAKNTVKEQRRSEIVEKLVRMEELEKEAAVMERKELYDQRRSHRSKVARLTQHMATVEMYDEWNAHDRLMCKFIRTKAKPAIFYLPAQHTPETEKLLQATKESIEEVIAERNKEAETFVTKEQDQSNVQPEAMETGGEGGEGGDEVARTEPDESMEVKASPRRRGRKRSGSDSGEASGSD